jgi:hypothetical protein
MIKAGTYISVKGFHKLGRKIFLIRGGRINPDKQTMHDQFKLHFLLTELMMKELDQSSATGLVGIQDASGMTMGHVALYQPALLKKFITIIKVSGILDHLCSNNL